MLLATTCWLLLMQRGASVAQLASSEAAFTGQEPQESATSSKVKGPTFTIDGLTTPALVAESVFALASSVPPKSTVTYYIDDQPVATEVKPPFWMGGLTGDRPAGYPVRSLSRGTHTLRAVASVPGGATWSSNSITLHVLASANERFSVGLAPYLNHSSAQQNRLASLLAQVTTPDARLSPVEASTRWQVMAMYVNWGVNPALDYENDQSEVLPALTPKREKTRVQALGTTSLSMRFSPDAPFYQSIPSAWPRVPLPSGYINAFQLNTTSGGDGIGFGVTIARPTDPSLPVRSEWYDQAFTLKTFRYPMSSAWSAHLPTLAAGDRHMIFVDPKSNTFVSSYKTSVNAFTKGPDALYASSPTTFGTLGLTGGSNAAGFAELPVLIQPGEATSRTQPIPHALGGPVARTWAARVFPASARDAGILDSANPCTGTGYMNTGLVPYGGLLQLDPAVDLTRLNLSLPAFRILQAMQTYGYYVMDFGCTDLDVYTSIAESELEPYGGLYGNAHGVGVQFEIEKVLQKSKLYVVAPLYKKQ